MTSAFPPAAVPGPEDVPEEENHHHNQPDPFGDPTDEEGRAVDDDEDPESRPKEDPRGE